MALELAVDRLGLFGHAVAFHQRKDRRLDRRDSRMEFQHGARLARHFVFGVCLAQKRQSRPVGAGRRFDHMRHEPLLAFFVEIAQVLAAELHVLAEVVVAPVRDSLELALTERETCIRCRRSPSNRTPAPRCRGRAAGACRTRAQIHVPLKPRLPPVGVPILGLLGPAEILDLHLLELARTEREVARVDLVAKTLADLRDAERELDPPGVDDVLEIGENPLGRLGPQIRDIRLAFQGADKRLEHQVERAGLGQCAAVVGRGADDFFAVG